MDGSELIDPQIEPSLRTGVEMIAKVVILLKDGGREKAISVADEFCRTAIESLLGFIAKTTTEIARLDESDCEQLEKLQVVNVKRRHLASVFLDMRFTYRDPGFALPGLFEFQSMQLSELY